MLGAIMMFMALAASVIEFVIGAITLVIGIIWGVRIKRFKAGKRVWSFSKVGYRYKQSHSVFAIISIVIGSMLIILSFVLFPVQLNYFLGTSGVI